MLHWNFISDKNYFDKYSKKKFSNFNKNQFFSNFISLFSLVKEVQKKWLTRFFFIVTNWIKYVTIYYRWDLMVFKAIDGNIWHAEWNHFIKKQFSINLIYWLITAKLNLENFLFSALLIQILEKKSSKNWDFKTWKCSKFFLPILLGFVFLLDEYEKYYLFVLPVKLLNLTCVKFPRVFQKIFSSI